jgi:cytochrome c5
MHTRQILKRISLYLPLLLLVACGGGEENLESAKRPMGDARTIVLDTRGQDIYDTNCVVCHGMAGTGAPISGKRSDWQERSAKGMEALLNNSMDGYQAMPAMGGCFDCTEEDFRQLITFMTSGSLE